MSKVDGLWDRYKTWSKEAPVDFLGKKFGQVYGHVIATKRGQPYATHISLID
jgi:hypothetical protein